MLQLLIKITALLLSYVSFYSFSFNGIDGNAIDMANYEGKKILLVNTALNSPYAAQLGELEQLHQQYKDSLVIIVFPSNSFGNEPGEAGDIASAIRNTYDAHYIIAEKTWVKIDSANTAHAVYQWLNDAGQNGSINAVPKNDFQKFLIGTDGKPMGIFKSSVSPMANELRVAIESPGE